ncbi:MAG: hypothetical protein ABSG64_13595 [Solirubrobacteraceae bacterium]|jgi:hypothetical protein
MDGSPREALEAALPALERAAAEKRATALVEHDLQEALESATNAGPAEIALRHWPEVGPFDLVLDGDVAFELQWGQSGDDLAGCAWDIAKLACATAERKISEGWLVAAAPAWHWDTHRPGVELLREHVYVGDDLAADYEDWWRLWCNEITTRPTHLPLSFGVTDVESMDVRLGRVPFVFRFARIEVLKHTWQPHVCPHRWHDRACLPRPWDPDGSGPRAR